MLKPGDEFDAVTGAFGYSGKYIARRLLALGRRVRTLTGDPKRPSPFGDLVEAVTLAFDRPQEMARNLAGAVTLYNTYWVRFPYGGVSFETAVENTRRLVRAAEEAGVRRIVHISITNAAERSPLAYFRGKAEVERLIQESRLSWAMVRPTVIFGPEDILIHNIAWLLRHSPLFAIPGEGDYLLQPVFVEDVAEIAVRAGQSSDLLAMDAVGPEVFTFEELVRLVAARLHSRARIVHAPPRLALAGAWAVGRLLGDVLLTSEELAGLMANLLVSERPATGRTLFSRWLDENTDDLGREYASELARHYS